MTTHFTETAAPIPDSKQFEFDKYLPSGVDFDHLVAETRQLKEFIEKAEEDIKAKKLIIESLLNITKVKVVSWRDEYVINRIAPKQTTKITIDAKLLLENGVTPEQIQKSTITKTSQVTGYITITKIQDRKGSEDEQLS